MTRRPWVLISILSVLGAANVAAADARVDMHRLNSQHELVARRAALGRVSAPRRAREAKVEALDGPSRVQVDKSRPERAPKTTRAKRTRASMQRN